jgi:hypothetical protein
MANEMDDLYLLIGASEGMEKGDNFRDGKGQVVVKKCICEKMNEGKTFVAVVKVVSSSSKGDLNPITKAPVEPNPAGTSVSWPQKIEKFKSAANNVKKFTLKLLGFAKENVTPPQFAEAFKRIISKEQPARGMLLNYETYQQPVRSGPDVGKPEGVRTYVNWGHVPPTAGNSPAEIAARRAELDKTDPL